MMGGRPRLGTIGDEQGNEADTPRDEDLKST